MAKIVDKNSPLIEKILVFILAICIFSMSGFYLYRFVERKYLYPLKYKQEIFYYSALYDLNPSLIFSVVKVESSFKATAKSNKGAYGLMQLTLNTASDIAKKLSIENFDLFDATTNINFGCYYLRYLIDKFENIKTAILAYNAGEGTVRSWLNDTRYSLDKKTIKTVPYMESKKYLERVQKSLVKYSKLYPKILDKK